jgi:hypothetical protein
VVLDIGRYEIEGDTGRAQTALDAVAAARYDRICSLGESWIAQSACDLYWSYSLRDVRRLRVMREPSVRAASDRFDRIVEGFEMIAWR